MSVRLPAPRSRELEELIDDVAMRAWRATEQWCRVPISAARYPAIRGAVAGFMAEARAPEAWEDEEHAEVVLAGRILCAVGDDLRGAHVLWSLAQTVPMAIHAAMLPCLVASSEEAAR